MRKNDIVEIEITGYTHEGLGVGRADGYVLFVPSAARGDLLRCRVVKALSTHGFGRIEAVLRPSPDRVSPDCPAFAQCGGCCYRHISYEAELAAKREQVRSALRKGLGREIPCAPCEPSPSVDRYRNKALIPFGREGYGFYRPHSHDVVPCRDCLIQQAEAGEVARTVWEHMKRYDIPVYDEATHTGLVRGVFVRTSRAGGQVMAVVIVNGGGIPHGEELVASLRAAVPGICSVQICVNRLRGNVPMAGELRVLWGGAVIEDLLSGNRYRISPHSFYQINSAQCERLYAAAGRLAGLTGSERLLDLYCGIGTIGLTLASLSAEVVGVETVGAAVADAREAALANGVGNARFIEADAGEAARLLAGEGFMPGVVVLDPPRKGCDQATVKAVVDMGPERVVYVSCNPSTLARDAALFEQLGYTLTGEALPFDMFPRTAHVETVVQLVLRNPVSHINIDVDVEELVQDKRGQATYPQIKAYVLEHSGLKVSSLYIAQVKLKHGIIERENYNKPKNEYANQPQCPPDKEKAIKEALEHFGMI